MGHKRLDSVPAKRFFLGVVDDSLSRDSCVPKIEFQTPIAILYQLERQSSDDNVGKLRTFHLAERLEIGSSLIARVSSLTVVHFVDFGRHPPMP